MSLYNFKGAAEVADLNGYHFFYFSFFLFLVGFLNFIFSRQNLIILLVSVEIMLLGASLNFLYVSFIYFFALSGLVYCLFLLVLAAAEAAVGLSLIVNYFFVRGHTDLFEIRSLRG